MRLWTGGRWALSYLRCWLAIPRSSQMSLRLPVKKFCTGKKPLQFLRRQIFRPTRPTYFFAWSRMQTTAWVGTGPMKLNRIPSSTALTGVMSAIKKLHINPLSKTKFQTKILIILTKKNPLTQQAKRAVHAKSIWSSSATPIRQMLKNRGVC